MLAALILSFVFDFFFIFWGLVVWGKDEPSLPIWAALAPMHRFGVFCYVLTNLLKILLTYLLWKLLAHKQQPVQLR